MSIKGSATGATRVEVIRKATLITAGYYGTEHAASLPRAEWLS